MPLLGLEVPTVEVDKLFDAWDPDKSGSLELSELNKILRRGGTIELSDDLKPGAAGEIVLESKAKFALRKGKLQNAGRGCSPRRCRPAAPSRSTRTAGAAERRPRDRPLQGMGCRRRWHVSKAEFRRAMPMLGVEVAPEVIDTLFDRFDPDKSGSIEMGEISKMMRRTDRGTSPARTSRCRRRRRRRSRSARARRRLDLAARPVAARRWTPTTTARSRAPSCRLARDDHLVEIELELDADQSGAVSKREFRKGMKTPVSRCQGGRQQALRLVGSRREWLLEFQELNKILVRRRPNGEEAEDRRHHAGKGAAQATRERIEREGGQ